MNDKLEKKLKAFLPYIIIIGIVYLLVPALLFTNSTALAYIILIGVLPLTALGCCAHYSMNKKNDILLSFVAPIFFLPAMFIYPMDDKLRALIYLVAYWLCGFLGLTVGDILSNRSKSSGSSKRPAPEAQERRAPQRRAAARIEEDADHFDDMAEPAPRRVRAPKHTAAPARPKRIAVDTETSTDLGAEDPYKDHTLDTSTTADDIDAILREIHQRRGND